MLVTNGGQLIRTRVEGIRIAGRSTQGVIVFDTADDERVVSVEHIPEEGEENGGSYGMSARPREAGTRVLALDPAFAGMSECYHVRFRSSSCLSNSTSSSSSPPRS